MTALRTAAIEAFLGRLAAQAPVGLREDIMGARSDLHHFGEMTLAEIWHTIRRQAAIGEKCLVIAVGATPVAGLTRLWT